ncbi:penicillin-binding protein [Stutzerimonas balearica]|nr:DUF4124 domain-containing protein [Stutzerimonas balearica]OMG67269.1 penicillin-binding protein [Stutzerimonas balearica]
MQLLAWLLLALLTAPAQAGIYSYLDAEGNRVFTDRPTTAAEPIELKPANQMPAMPLPAPATQAPPPTPTRAGYQALRIISPAADATVRDNAGNLTINGASEPPLRPGHRYQLLFDGQPYGEPGESGTFALHNVDRGTHRIALLILAADGSELARSAEQDVHLRRMSLVQRRKARPCAKDDYGVRLECPLKDKPEEKRDIPFVPYL